MFNTFRVHKTCFHQWCTCAETFNTIHNIISNIIVDYLVLSRLSVHCESWFVFTLPSRHSIPRQCLGSRNWHRLTWTSASNRTVRWGCPCHLVCRCPIPIINVLDIFVKKIIIQMHQPAPHQSLCLCLALPLIEPPPSPWCFQAYSPIPIINVLNILDQNMIIQVHQPGPHQSWCLCLALPLIQPPPPPWCFHVCSQHHRQFRQSSQRGDAWYHQRYHRWCCSWFGWARTSRRTVKLRMWGVVQWIISYPEFSHPNPDPLCCCHRTIQKFFVAQIWRHTQSNPGKM